MRPLHLVLLAAFAVALVGCAHLDPLGSPAHYKRDADGEYKADFETKAGVICRDLSGQANIRDISGVARGARVLEVGDEELKGCYTCEYPGITYRSKSCLGDGP